MQAYLQKRKIITTYQDKAKKKVKQQSLAVQGQSSKTRKERNEPEPE